jgi:hypothetical protein
VEGGRALTELGLHAASALNGHLPFRPYFPQPVGDELELLQLKEAKNAKVVYGHVKDDRGGEIVA